MLGAYHHAIRDALENEDAVNVIRHDDECVCSRVREVAWYLVPGPLDYLPNRVFFKDEMSLVGANGHRVGGVG